MNTLDYYNGNAKHYFDTTVNADMSKQYEFFLKYVKEQGKILDMGCGSGRDSLFFKNKGYKVDAIDGSSELCKLAREYTGIDVKCMKFEDLDMFNEYDGIWACASLLHVDKKLLLEVLKKIRDALKIDGVLYTGFKNGTGEEVTKEGRYFNYLTYDNFLEVSSNAGLEIIDFNSSKSVSNPNETHYWNNYVLKKK